MARLTLSNMLDRYQSIHQKLFGVLPRRSRALEIVAATNGYHNSNELTAACSRESMTIPCATRAFNAPMVCITDPVSQQTFALPYAQVMAAATNREQRIIVSPYGNLIDISGVLSPSLSEEDATRLPTADEIMKSLPDYDPAYPVRATIQTDDLKIQFDLDAGPWLASLSADDLEALAFSQDWSSTYETDELLRFEPIQNAQSVHDLYSHMNATNGHSDEIGFYVTLEPEQVNNWLKAKHPDIYARAELNA